MMIPPHVHKLMDADVLGWHPDYPPFGWCRWAHGGLHIRVFWRFGVVIRRRHSVMYYADDVQRWIESWCGY